MIQPLDGPSSQGTLSSVGTTTVVEAKVGVSPLEERKVITLQGDSRYYIYFGDGTGTPTAGTVTSNGFLAFKDAMVSLEASDSQSVYVLAVSGTVNIKIAERA
jgi:hypothetical protein